MNLGAIEDIPAGQDLPTVGWLVNVTDFDSASVRYRCAHPLASLSQRGVASVVHHKAETLARELDRVDAVIIVKRLDAGLVNLVAAAAEAAKPVYLDLCDDVIAEEGRSSLRHMPLAALRAIAPLLSAILCPTPAMRTRIQGYLQAEGLADVVVKVLPDCIETDELYALSKAVWQSTPGTGSAAHDGRDAALPKLEPAVTRLCWFGNWGGPHSDFGLMSLLPVLGRLNAYEHRHELALHLVSNHRELAQFIQQKARFPVVYHDWSRGLLGGLLAQTQFTLVTSGDDQFSAIKSPNRALLSLAAGVPVIVEAGAESVGALWADPQEMPLTEKIVEILNDVREHGYAAVRQRLLAATAPSLARYRIEHIGASYLELLLGATRSSNRAPAAAPARIAHVFAADEDLDLALEIRRACEAEGIEFLAITSLKDLQRRKALFNFFAEHAIKPSVVAEEEGVADDTRRLRGAQLVVQASSRARDFGALVGRWCEKRGVPMTSQGAFLYRYRRR